MSNFLFNIGGAEPNWMQHHAPWLAALVMMLGLWNAEATPGQDIGLDG